MSCHNDRPSTSGQCIFFSRHLSTAEKNYDVGNKELLAVFLVPQEWRHRLEGAFLVWIDHKNLSYLQSARRLNSCQARWAYFLDQFNFTLSYPHESQNIKADALLRQSVSERDSESQVPIFPPSCLSAAVHWEIEDTVL